MSDTIIYGIKNCDTMKKAFSWLNERGVDYNFHDYKKSGADSAVLKNAFKTHGWENVINRRGTTWRSLPDGVKAAMNDTNAINAALENPSLIKRPLLVHKGTVHLGFSIDTYAEVFKNICLDFFSDKTQATTNRTTILGARQRSSEKKGKQI